MALWGFVVSLVSLASGVGPRVFPPGSAEMRELETAYAKAISTVSPTPFVTTFFRYGETDLTSEIE